MTDIHVVSIADNHYAQHLSVSLVSLLMNKSPGSSVHLYVLSTDFNEENQSKLLASVAGFDAHVEFIQADASAYRDFRLFTFVTRETFIRLSIPDVLPNTVDKVICLDSDTVVTGDIAELWQIDFKGHAIAAVTDVGGLYRCKDLSIPVQRYFNAGIYMMNLAKWREKEIGSRTLAYIAEHTERLIYLDQDGLNAILYDDWLEIADKWNVQTNMLTGKLWNKSRKPGIIHYTGQIKPWHFNSTHPYKKAYYDYLAYTEWRTFRPKINARSVALRIVQPVKSFLKRIAPEPALAAIRKRT
ncbi:hypothetical protein B1A99_03145 [Cohnella sp. CIP 111063]|uniref:glycosyltransferase family 8 protein n=1 Tax=unclassified Cohnella TaxID=2636738 RepID=UPI000B8BE376|nr:MULTISPECIES: glycosyltransferase family 8 protein [unclassified Cohnella]OXS61627.1 hypothetical protein B1A99_03145 [Cohnella sp. CIP 111063]PRX74045.1 lipopolysaccharide biosynthesis glycosyltransferase [Cohnella sp. SGD-V74]